MLRLITALALIAVSAVVISKVSAAPNIAVSKTLDLPAFTELDITADLTTNVVVGEGQSVAVEASNQGSLDDLRLEVINGRLYAWRQNDVWDVLSFRDDSITVTITVPSLEALSASAASQVSVTGMSADTLTLQATSSASVNAENLTSTSIVVEASGAAELILSGECISAEVDVSSSASIDGERLACVDLDIAASSSAYAVMWASGHVNADVSSVATVLLAGNPERIDDAENSGGTVRVLD